MLRISLVGEGVQGVTLRLEGRVVGPWIAELREACEKVLVEKQTLMLDLSEVWFADRAALALLLHLRSQGVVLSGCSPFLSQELKAAEMAGRTIQKRKGGNSEN
jgi:ABC-type transporter Mla MlaB component